MRNLKRALSLVMAAAMLIGMMVVSASAASTYEDFTDKDEIVNKEAVATMVSLGVINGKEDGSYFDPTGIVTRAEMAKLIAVSYNGGKDLIMGSGATTTQFTDTKGNWAEAYIAWCANLGIINGKGDGTFGPNDPVTGTAAAKMMLTALGYRSDIEKLTGAGWDLNTDTLANKVGLYDGLDNITPSNGLSRDDTAQLIYNGIQAQEVEYRNNYGEYSGVIYPQDNGTMLENRFNVRKVEGVVVANNVVALDEGATTVKGKTRLSDIYYGGNHYVTEQGRAIDVTYPVEIGNELLGQRVVLYVKGLKDLAPNAANMEVVGFPIVSDKNTVAETAKRLKDDSAVKSFLSGNNLSLTAAGGNALASGTVFYTENDTDFDQPLDRAFAVTSEANVNGTELTFIDHDGDGAVDYVFKTLPRMAKVTVYNESGKKLTIAGEGSIDFTDIANEEDVAKDDVVLYYKMNETWYLEKAETISGEVTAYNNNSKTVSVDGTSYGKSTIALEKSSTDLEDFGAEMPMVGNTYTFYMDRNNNIVGWVLGEESVGNYAIVLSGKADATPGFEAGSVKLLMADGTVATYDLNLLATANKFGVASGGSTAAKEAAMVARMDKVAGDANDGQGLNNMIVTYVVGENGKVTLGDPAKISNTYSSVTDGVGNYTAPATTVSRNVARYSFTNSDATKNVSVSVNDSTIFFIRNITGDGNTFSVVNGLSKLPVSAITGSSVLSAVYTTTSANPNVAKAVVVDGTYRGTSSYVYVTDSYIGTRNVNGEEVYTYPVVYENGEAGTLVINRSNVAKGQAYRYTMDTSSVASVDVPDEVYNGYVSTYARGSNLSVRTGDGLTQLMTDGRTTKGSAAVQSFTVLSNANLWNVEDAPYAESLTSDMSMCFVLDSEGFVKTVFVDDTNATLTTNITAASGLGLSFNSTSVYSGYDIEVTGASNGDKLTYEVIYTNGEKEVKKVVVSSDDVGYISVPKNADSIKVTAINATEGGDEPAPSTEITVTVPKADYADSEFYLNDVKVPESSISEGLVNLTFKAKRNDVLSIMDATAFANADEHFRVVANADPLTVGDNNEVTFTLTGNTALIAPAQMRSVEINAAKKTLELNGLTYTITAVSDEWVADNGTANVTVTVKGTASNAATVTLSATDGTVGTTTPVAGGTTTGMDSATNGVFTPKTTGAVDATYTVALTSIDGDVVVSIAATV